jgi:hypothetical protein
VRAALFRNERRHCALSASLWVSRRPPHVSGVCSFPGVQNSLCPPPPNFAFDTRTHLASHAVRRVRAALFRNERRHCALSASLWVSRRPPHVSGVCSFPGVQNSLCHPPVLNPRAIARALTRLGSTLHSTTVLALTERASRTALALAHNMMKPTRIGNSGAGHLGDPLEQWALGRSTGAVVDPLMHLTLGQLDPRDRALGTWAIHSSTGHLGDLLAQLSIH